MENRCPKCGASEWNIWGATTLMYGPVNTTTWTCTCCGHTWKEGEYVTDTIVPIEYEIQSQYGALKDWLVENYAERPDVGTVYEALVNLLTKLDETTLRGLR